MRLIKTEDWWDIGNGRDDDLGVDGDSGNGDDSNDSSDDDDDDDDARALSWRCWS